MSVVLTIFVFFRVGNLLKQKKSKDLTANKKQFDDYNLRTDDFHPETMQYQPLVVQPREPIEPPPPPPMEEEPMPMISHVEEPTPIIHQEMPEPVPVPEVHEHHEPVLLPVPIAAPAPPPPPPCTVHIPVTVHLKGKLAIKMKHCQKCDFSKNIEAIGPLKISSLSQLEDKLKQNIDKAFKVKSGGKKKSKLQKKLKNIRGTKRDSPPVIDYEQLNRLNEKFIFGTDDDFQDDETGMKKDQVTSSSSTDRDLIVRKFMSIPRIFIPSAAYKRGVVISLPKGKAMLKCVVPKDDDTKKESKTTSSSPSPSPSPTDGKAITPKLADLFKDKKSGDATSQTMTDVDNDVVTLSTEEEKSVKVPAALPIQQDLQANVEPTQSPISPTNNLLPANNFVSAPSTTNNKFTDSFMKVVDKDMLVSLYKMAVHDIMSELQTARNNAHQNNVGGDAGAGIAGAGMKSKIKMLNNERSELERQFPGIGSTLIAPPQDIIMNTQQLPLQPQPSASDKRSKAPTPELPKEEKNTRRVKLIDTDRPRLRLPVNRGRFAADEAGFFGDMDPSRLIGDRDKDCIEPTCQKQKEFMKGASRYFQDLDSLALAPYEEYMVDGMKVNSKNPINRDRVNSGKSHKRQSIETGQIEEPNTIVELFGKLPRVPLKITLNPKGPLAKLKEPITIDLKPPDKATHTRAIATANIPSVVVTVADRIFKDEPVTKKDEQKLQAVYADLRRRSLLEPSHKIREIHVDPTRFERLGKRMKIVVSLPKELTKLLSNNNPGEATTRNMPTSSSSSSTSSTVASPRAEESLPLSSHGESPSRMRPQILEYENTLKKLKEETKEAMIQLNHLKDPYSDIGQKRSAHKRHHTHHHKESETKQNNGPDPYADVGGFPAKRRRRRSASTDEGVEVGAIIESKSDNNHKGISHFMSKKERYEELSKDPYATMGTSASLKRSVRSTKRNIGSAAIKRESMNKHDDHVGVGGMSFIAHTESQARSPTTVATAPAPVPAATESGKDILQQMETVKQVAPQEAPSTASKLMLESLPKFKEALTKINPETRRRLFEMKPFRFLANMQQQSLSSMASANTGARDPYADLGNAVVRSKTKTASSSSSSKQGANSKKGAKRDPYADLGSATEVPAKRARLKTTTTGVRGKAVKKSLRPDPFADIGHGGDPTRPSKFAGKQARKSLSTAPKKIIGQHKIHQLKKHDPFADIGFKRHQLPSNTQMSTKTKKAYRRDPLADIGSAVEAKRAHTSSTHNSIKKKHQKRGKIPKKHGKVPKREGKVGHAKIQIKHDPFADIGSVEKRSAKHAHMLDMVHAKPARRNKRGKKKSSINKKQKGLAIASKRKPDESTKQRKEDLDNIKKKEEGENESEIDKKLNKDDEKENLKEMETEDKKSEKEDEQKISEVENDDPKTKKEETEKKIKELKKKKAESEEEAEKVIGKDKEMEEKNEEEKIDKTEDPKTLENDDSGTKEPSKTYAKDPYASIGKVILTNPPKGEDKEDDDKKDDEKKDKDKKNDKKKESKNFSKEPDLSHNNSSHAIDARVTDGGEKTSQNKSTAESHVTGDSKSGDTTTVKNAPTSSSFVKPDPYADVGESSKAWGSSSNSDKPASPLQLTSTVEATAKAATGNVTSDNNKDNKTTNAEETRLKQELSAASHFLRKANDEDKAAADVIAKTEKLLRVLNKTKSDVTSQNKKLEDPYASVRYKLVDPKQPSQQQQQHMENAISESSRPSTGAKSNKVSSDPYLEIGKDPSLPSKRNSSSPTKVVQMKVERAEPYNNQKTSTELKSMNKSKSVEASKTAAKSMSDPYIEIGAFSPSPTKRDGKPHGNNSTKIENTKTQRADPYSDVGESPTKRSEKASSLGKKHNKRSRRSTVEKKSTGCFNPYASLGEAAVRSNPDCVQAPALKFPNGAVVMKSTRRDPYSDIGKRSLNNSNEQKRVYLPKNPAVSDQEATSQNVTSAEKGDQKQDFSKEKQTSNATKDPYAEMGREVHKRQEMEKGDASKLIHQSLRTQTKKKARDPYAELGSSLHPEDTKRSNIQSASVNAVQPTEKQSTLLVDPYADLGTSIGLTQNEALHNNKAQSSVAKDEINNSNNKADLSPQQTKTHSPSQRKSIELISAAPVKETSMAQPLQSNVEHFTSASQSHIGPHDTADPYVDSGKADSKGDKDSSKVDSLKTKELLSSPNHQEAINSKEMEKAFEVTANVAQEINTIKKIEKAISTEKSKVQGSDVAASQASDEYSLAMNVGKELKFPYKEIGGAKRSSWKSEKALKRNMGLKTKKMRLKKSRKKSRCLPAKGKKNGGPDLKILKDPYVLIGSVSEMRRRQEVICDDDESISKEVQSILPNTHGEHSSSGHSNMDDKSPSLEGNKAETSKEESDKSNDKESEEKSDREDKNSLKEAERKPAADAASEGSSDKDQDEKTAAKGNKDKETAKLAEDAYTSIVSGSLQNPAPGKKLAASNLEAPKQGEEEKGPITKLAEDKQDANDKDDNSKSKEEGPSDSNKNVKLAEDSESSEQTKENSEALKQEDNQEAKQQENSKGDKQQENSDGVKQQENNEGANQQGESESSKQQDSEKVKQAEEDPPKTEEAESSKSEDKNEYVKPSESQSSEEKQQNADSLENKEKASQETSSEEKQQEESTEKNTENSDASTSSNDKSPEENPVSSPETSSVTDESNSDMTNYLLGKTPASQENIQDKSSQETAVPDTSHVTANTPESTEEKPAPPESSPSTTSTTEQTSTPEATSTSSEKTESAYASTGSDVSYSSGEKKHVTLKRPQKKRDPYADMGQATVRSHIPKPSTPKDNFAFLKVEDKTLEDVSLTL